MINHKHYCPKCGAHDLHFSGDKVFTCASCDFVFYFNAASAVGGVIRRGDEVLMGIRAFDPAKGLLDFPGGFVDRGENLEQALIREIKEELGLNVIGTRYLTSATNDYLYKNVPYITCDAYFLCDVEKLDNIQANDDISAYRWVDIHSVSDDDFAFESSRVAIRRLREGSQ